MSDAACVMPWDNPRQTQNTPPVITVIQLRKIAGNVPGFVKGFYGGSRVICDPAPTDTDCDIALHVQDVSEAVEFLLKESWELPDEDNEYNGEYGDFRTVRQGEYNLMLFETPEEYGAVLAATCIAMWQNLTEKAHRYQLFETARGFWR